MTKGLQVRYAELLTLSTEQSFYDNRFCRKYSTFPSPDFLLQPTAECSELMQRLDMLCRNSAQTAGVTVMAHVLGKNMGGDDLLRYPARDDDKLSFWMIASNPAVFNFDELPVASDTSQLFYFTNQTGDMAAARTDLHLSMNATVDGTADRVMRSGSSYSYKHSAIVPDGAAVVKHTLSGVEISPRSITTETGKSILYFDLVSLPLGKCTLFINHISFDEFYYTGDVIPERTFGIIELSLSSLLDANYRIIEADRSLTTQRPYNKIKLLNRSTIWRYSVELASNSPLYLEWKALSAADRVIFKNQLNIITNDLAISFAQASANPEGTRYEFVSSNAVALREKYISSSSVTKDTLSLTLKKYIGNADPSKEAPVKTDLACPSAGSINALNSPTIYSDIFLTL